MKLENHFVGQILYRSPDPVKNGVISIFSIMNITRFFLSKLSQKPHDFNRPIDVISACTVVVLPNWYVFRRIFFFENLTKIIWGVTISG